jgi:hypothetical protein
MAADPNEKVMWHFFARLVQSYHIRRGDQDVTKTIAEKPRANAPDKLQAPAG